MRVLHLPTTVGDPSGLSSHLRKLGIDSQVWTITQNYLDYPVDRVIAQEGLPAALRALKVLGAARYVFGRWDVIHYNFGSTLFSRRLPTVGRGVLARMLAVAHNAVATVLQTMELGILRARRIPIVVHYQGDDARQGDYSLTHYRISIATQVPEGYYTPESDRQKRRQIRRLTSRAARTYAVNPDLMNVLPTGTVFLPYGHFPVNSVEPVYTRGERDRIVFGHAPSNRAVKGTDLILAALDDLAAEGLRFDLELVEGVTNAEALDRYRGVDVLIDQLFAGWYGGVAVEAMALGKPVIAYLRDEDLRHLPSAMAEELPIIAAEPDTITDVLREVITMPPAEFQRLAERSRRFVERWHDPDEIASQIATDYQSALNARGSNGERARP